MSETENLVRDALNNKNTQDRFSKKFNNSAYFSREVDRELDRTVDRSLDRTLDRSATRYSFNQDLDTSNGLYRLAAQSGLQKEADRIIADNSGEDLNKIYSGGFISDVFDTLNIASYGVVGLLKGKSFAEGIESRESFSDKDSLGKYGLGGVIAGTVLDIVTDPFTYIAPWTVLKKIPGVTKVGKAAKEAVVGREVIKTIAETGQTYSTLEGGIAGGKGRALVQKFAYMFGADPVYRETYERMQAMIGKETTEAVNKFVKPLSGLDPKTSQHLLKRDKTGRFVRNSLDDLERSLDSETFGTVKGAWEGIDNLGKRMVELGLLSKDKYEENLGRYIKNVYSEYELAKNKGLFGFKSIKGISAQKARKEGLTPERMAELGQIEDPAYLVGRTMVQMISDIHNAEFFKSISKFGSVTKFDGAVQVPQSRRFEVMQGKNAEIKLQVKKLSDQIKPLEKELNISLGADKDVLKEIKSIKKEIAKLQKMEADELTRFFEGDRPVASVKTTASKVRTIPERLSPLANMLKKFDDYDEMMKSKAGIELEKLWMDGVLERNGFRGGEQAMKNFFDAVKKPFTPSTSKVVIKGGEDLGDDVLDESLAKAVEFRKRIENLMSKATNLSDIDKRSINDSLRAFEKQLNEARLDRDDLVDALHMNKMSELAGKYIPEEMYQYIDEIINPTEPFGNKIMSEFKYMKVVMNPGTHVRNIMSNQILNWWKLGIGPWRQDVYIKAGLELKNKGKYWDEWTSVGGGADTYAAQELRQILDGPDTTFLKGKMGKWWTKAKQTLGDVYQSEEALAKMAAFMEMRKKGHTIDEAFKMSQSATFNYAQVTPMIRKIRTAIWGMPFITFAAKATPLAIETAMKNPGRISVFGKIRNNIANASDIQQTEEELAAEPAWVKEGFYFKLPVQDQYGRSMYFDLTYIIPFGDIVSGTLFQRPLNTDTGTKEALPISLASTNPAFQLLKELTRNETFTGQKVFKGSDDLENQLADISRHIFKTFSPPWLSNQLPSGYDKRTGEKTYGGFRGAMQSSDENQKRTPTQEAMAAFLGMKVQPLNADISESFQEWNKKKGLQTLLMENNIMSNFSRPYIPQ